MNDKFILNDYYHWLYYMVDGDPGNNTGCNGSEKGFKQSIQRLLKNFSKKVSKNLVVTKKGFTFAPLSAPKWKAEF